MSIKYLKYQDNVDEFEIIDTEIFDECNKEEGFKYIKLGESNNFHGNIMGVNRERLINAILIATKAHNVNKLFWCDFCQVNKINFVDGYNFEVEVTRYETIWEHNNKLSNLVDKDDLRFSVFKKRLKELLDVLPKETYNLKIEGCKITKRKVANGKTTPYKNLNQYLIYSIKEYIYDNYSFKNGYKELSKIFCDLNRKSIKTEFDSVNDEWNGDKYIYNISTYESAYCETVSSKNFKFMVENNISYIPSDKITKYIPALIENPLLFSKMNNELYGEIKETLDSNSFLETLFYIENDKQLNLYLNIIDKIRYIEEQLATNSLSLSYSKHSLADTMYSLCAKYNYDLEELTDYLVSLPFSQGNTSISLAATYLKFFNLMNEIPHGEYPTNINSMHKNITNKEALKKCVCCKTYNYGLDKCHKCGSENMMKISSPINTCENNIESIINTETFFFTNIDVKNLFEMNIEYFSLKTTAKPSFQFYEDVLYKIFRNDVSGEFLESSKFFTKTVCDIVLKRENKINITRNGRKYPNLKNFQIAINELSELMKFKGIELDTCDLATLFQYPNLELLYKTKYNIFIPALISSNNFKFLNNISNPKYKNIKDILGRNKQELDMIYNWFISVDDKKYSCILVFLLYGEYTLKVQEVIELIDVVTEYEPPSRNFYSSYGDSIVGTIKNIISLLNEGYTLKKIIKYIQYQMDNKLFDGIYDCIYYIRDYLHSLKLLNNSDKVSKGDLYPKDLVLNHDRAAFMYTMRKNELLNQKFELVSKENQIYNYIPRPKDIEEEENKNKYKYAIISPTTADDLKFEGLTLSHCVGTYINKYIERRCKIFFLREQENIDTPLVTIELNEFNQVVQAKGKHNREITAAERKFIEQWLGNIANKVAA